MYNTSNEPEEFKAITYMLPMGNIRGAFEFGLKPHLGVATEYIDLSHIVFILVENRLFGNVMAAGHLIVDYLEDYGIPRDVAEGITVQARDTLNLLFSRMLPDGVDGWVWAFDFTGRGDLKLVCLGKPKLRLDPDAIYRQSVLDGLERGDWYPMNVRRMVGAE